MNYTIYQLSPDEDIFFMKLRSYLDKNIYFYGSIQRLDYIPKKSDIDVVVFTDNINSTLSKLTSFLSISRDKMKLSYLYANHRLIPGYKVSVKEEYQFRCEISVYNEVYQEDVLKEHQRKIKFPVSLSILLIITKVCYYHIGIIPLYYYKQIKKWLIDLYFKPESCIAVI
jgi:predicted nucleotidyltransferase